MTAEAKNQRALVPIDGLLSSADLATLLRTSTKQIANMRARGQLPAPAKVPGLGLRWSRPLIDAWIAQQVAAR